MNNHKQEILDTVICPFAIAMDKIDWDDADKILSVGEKEKSVIVKMKNGDIFLVNIHPLLFAAIYREGEKNVEDQDLGFNDLSA